MTAITVRGDVERFCLGADPTCTGINPCMQCWEAVRDSVMPASLRKGEIPRTTALAEAYRKEFNLRWKEIVAALHVDRPDLFQQTAQMRRPAMMAEWEEARRRNVVPPLCPFSAVACMIWPGGQGAQQAQQVQPVQATQQPVEPVQTAPEVPAQPEAVPKPPDWPPDELEKAPARGEVKRIMANGAEPRPMKSSLLSTVANGAAEMTNGELDHMPPDPDFDAAIAKEMGSEK